jgi:hypothetical protein
MRQGKQNLNGRVSISFTFAILLIATVMAVIALPNFIQEPNTGPKNNCINNLRLLDAAEQQWALENNKTNSEVPTWSDLKGYLGRGGMVVILKCPLGGKYTLVPVTSKPTCSYPGHVLP